MGFVWEPPQVTPAGSRTWRKEGTSCSSHLRSSLGGGNKVVMLKTSQLGGELSKTPAPAVQVPPCR